MCNCRKTNEVAAIDYLKAKHPNTLKVSNQAGLVNLAAVKEDGQLIAVGFDEVEVWVQPISKKGIVGNSKKQRVPFVHSYCPHCGEKLR